MPDMNGLQLYREIRKRDEKVKICFLTASETILNIPTSFLQYLSFLKTNRK